jgi:hypothetical protein
MAARRPLVRVEGLKELRRTLRQMDRQLPRALGKDLKAAAEFLLPYARELLPEQSGRLRGSLRVGGSGARVYIYARSSSSEPKHNPAEYSGFIYWGGTTGRGHHKGGGGEVDLPRRDFPGLAPDGGLLRAAHPAVHQAAHEHEQELLAAFERAFQEFAGRCGWH